MTRKTSWKVCATTARPRIATASQTRSPRTRPAANTDAPCGPRPITRATNAAMPGPGEAAATSNVPANRKRCARSIGIIRTKKCGRISVGRLWNVGLQRAAPSGHDPENARPRLDRGWMTVFGQDHAPPNAAAILSTTLWR